MTCERCKELEAAYAAMREALSETKSFVPAEKPECGGHPRWVKSIVHKMHVALASDAGRSLLARLAKLEAALEAAVYLRAACVDLSDKGIDEVVNKVKAMRAIERFDEARKACDD